MCASSPMLCSAPLARTRPRDRVSRVRVTLCHPLRLLWRPGKFEANSTLRRYSWSLRIPNKSMDGVQRDYSIF